jgi:phosphoglycolate phosphatase-like HAD superfamily hydrolase
MRPTVLLFDVDGTLLSTGGAGRRAIERTFAEHLGRPDACSGFRFDGMTDRGIVRKALTAIEVEPTDAAIDDLLAAYVAVLEDEVARAPNYRVHAGMEHALDAAAARDGVAIGLGTGNIREGARVKLSRAGLYERFAFGGFGCDHEHRPTLIEIGARRGAERLGEPLSACRVVIIGDTPSDVAAAQAIGGECVGVGTGHFTPGALLACGATRAFSSLDEPGAIEALLGA